MNRTARRDDGMRRISVLTRWAAAGAVVGAGLLSAVVAKALPGRASAAPASSGPANATDGSAATDGGGATADQGSPSFDDPGSQVPDTLTPPVQAPTRSRSRGSVVSGGS